jgi:hypothetical protein
MVWNASRPADSDRIRLSAELIRDNWTAIETGTVPFDTISLENQTLFPPLENHIRLYGYTNNASGQVELTSINPAGQRVRLTQGDKLGAINQSAVFNNITVSSFTLGSISNTQDSFCTAWARVNSAGSLVSSYRIASSVKNSTGVYTITLSPTLLNANYLVIATSRDTSIPNSNRTCMVTAQTASTFRVRTQRNNSDPGYEDTDCDFCVAVFGGLI